MLAMSLISRLLPVGKGSRNMHPNPQHLASIALTGVPQDNNPLHFLSEHAEALRGLKQGKALNRKAMIAEMEFPQD